MLPFRNKINIKSIFKHLRLRRIIFLVFIIFGVGFLTSVVLIFKNHKKEVIKTPEILVIGSGLSGSMIARLYANMGKKVLVVEKKAHLGGNLHDYIDDNGVLTNLYGPHVFRTNEKRIWDFINTFSEFNRYEHRVVGILNSKKVPIPINIDSANIILNNIEVSVSDSDEFLSAIESYSDLFQGYIDVDEDIRSNFDSRYYDDKYQGLPQWGYTNLIKRILNSSNIIVKKGVDLKRNEIINSSGNFTEIYYTGRIDEYFSYEFGELDYKSFEFEKEEHNKIFYQSNSVVKFPKSEKFRRIIEYKHFYGQGSSKEKTRIFKEYETDGGHPSCLVLNEENKKKFRKYELLVKEETKKKNIYFLGRLSKFNNPNLGGIVSSVIEFFEKLYPTMKDKNLITKQKAKPRKLSISIVVAHCNENLIWILNEIEERRKEFSPVRVFLYNKCDLSIRKSMIKKYDKIKDVEIKIISLPNIGREGHTFLHFMFTSPSYFSDINVFYQGWREGDLKDDILRWNNFKETRIKEEYDYRNDVQRENHFFSLKITKEEFSTNPWYYWFKKNNLNIKKLRHHNGKGLFDSFFS